MSKQENIKNYYKKKYFEQKQKERNEIYNESLKKISYKDNSEKAFHNCWSRAPNFKGYIDEFKLQMESLFKDGMCWENYPEWEIDHIIPLAKGGKHEVSNLQPLWMRDNRVKSNKI